MQSDITTVRENLGKICTVPDKIISVYSLEQHVWAEGHDLKAIQERRPELQTIEEFQIDPVRHFLNDIFRNIAAPYKPGRGNTSIGQGYWIQAEFGSGKSHLLCFIAALALGSERAWDLIKLKEEKAGRGKRESFYQFWENGIKQKSSGDSKGLFVISKTLVGVGSGTVGYDKKGKDLSEYILDAAKIQLERETGKNISLYPVELLADRFITKDLELYRTPLRKFLKDPKFFAEDEFEDVDEFIDTIRENQSPEYKRSCGNKLWRFYTEYLEVKPDIEVDTEEVLKHMVTSILNEGYSGILILLDEISNFMKTRDESLRSEDEKTLVVLSNRLGKVENLPVWTVCAAQQAIESRMSVKNIIADDRLKLVLLLREEKDYYTIVLSRVREIIKPESIQGYYNYYKRGFTWPNSIGEDEFRIFFPFHKPAIEILRDITYELTTTRSAIHFMHQTLKRAIKDERDELIRLWDFFDEALEYEEDPSGTHAGIAAIRTKREEDYKIYLACKRGIDEKTKGALKVYRDRALKTLQILFLNFIAKRSVSKGLSPEDLANSVLIELSPQATIQENIEHYESLAVNLSKEFPQISEYSDEDALPHFRFVPESIDIKPSDIWSKARNEAEASEKMQSEAWQHLLGLDEWPVKTRKMTYDLSHGVRSIFREISPFITTLDDSVIRKRGHQIIEVLWKNRKILGKVEMVDLRASLKENRPLSLLETDQTDIDFSIVVSNEPLEQSEINRILKNRKDPRVVIWVPGTLTKEETDLLIDFAAYRKMIFDFTGKESDEAISMINWVNDRLQTEMGRFKKIVDSRYARGEMNALNHTSMEFRVAGELPTIVAPIVERVLNSVYESKLIDFSDIPISFTKEYGVNVINGIVKTGSIPKGVKLGKNEDAAQNFGKGLMIVKTENWRELDITQNPFISALNAFINDKLIDSNSSMSIDTIYKNFMGIHGPGGKHFGLSKRILQIYLLCLVRTGRIRLHLGAKSPISFNFIDYSNISEIEFNTRLLDSFTEFQKISSPENWDVLRPYAEKLLEEDIPESAEEFTIAHYRAKLRSLFSEEKERSQRVFETSKTLFGKIGTSNPFEQEISQLYSFFTYPVSEGNDIDAILFSLKEAFGYNAFELNSPQQGEVDDLAIKIKRYHDLQQFLEFDHQIVAISAYCAHSFPNVPELKRLHKIKKTLCPKLQHIERYVDNELTLKNELIGSSGVSEGEQGTFTALIQEYTSLYKAMHDRTVSEIESSLEEMDSYLQSDEMATIMVMTQIPALSHLNPEINFQPLKDKKETLISCETGSYASIEQDLRESPVHHCGISFHNYSDRIESGKNLARDTKLLLDSEFHQIAEFFMNPLIKERLSHGKREPVIAGLSNCSNIEEMKSYLINSCKNNGKCVEIINRYLKKIKLKKIRIADFSPSTKTIEREQIPLLVKEFQEFLESQLEQEPSDKDSVSMLQLE